MSEDQAPHRSAMARAIALLFLALAFAGFAALGAWQVQRLHWKHALIARVESRVHAEAAAPPARAAWPAVTAESDEYRRVFVNGRYLRDQDTRVQALTELGAGWWLLSPLRTDGGDIIFVNRGFVPVDGHVQPPPQGQVSITGLLRITEPNGGFLRSNAPDEDRWHSRDVVAIAHTRGLPADRVAPYFIDAELDSTQDASGWPRAGMTVIAFRDHHLQYALTWFAMALLTAGAGTWLFVSGRRLRQHQAGSTGTFRNADHAAGR